MTVTGWSRKAVAWLTQFAADRRAIAVLSQMSAHSLHDIGIDRGGIDYAVRNGRIGL